MANAIISWAEAHPTESILIGGGGVLVILYFLGFFGSSGSNANAGASNLAAAYYAAEANQATVSGQIQLATVNDAAATAQVQDQVQGAVAINQAQQSTYGIISDNQTSANANTNAANIAMNASNNAAADYGNEVALQTTLGQTMLGTIVPQELALTGGVAAYDMPGGLGEYYIDPYGGNAATSVNTPQSLQGIGYSPAQAAQLLGVTP